MRNAENGSADSSRRKTQTFLILSEVKGRTQPIQP
jgi:hypothetical protein